MATLVVHFKREPFDVYIGRQEHGCHYGNPFSHKEKSRATVVVASRAESILFFRQWLEGSAWQHIEPARRQWILQTLYQLKGKRLGCWCKPEDCHGDVLAEFADRT